MYDTSIDLVHFVKTYIKYDFGYTYNLRANFRDLMLEGIEINFHPFLYVI